MSDASGTGCSRLSDYFWRFWPGEPSFGRLPLLVVFSSIMPLWSDRESGRSVDISGQADSAKLPAGVRRKEVAVASSGVATRRDTRGAAQDELVVHELTVVFPQRPSRRAVSGIARIVARCPLPDIPVQLKEAPQIGRGDS